MPARAAVEEVQRWQDYPAAYRLRKIAEPMLTEHGFAVDFLDPKTDSDVGGLRLGEGVKQSI